MPGADAFLFRWASQSPENTVEQFPVWQSSAMLWLLLPLVAVLAASATLPYVADCETDPTFATPSAASA